VRRGEGDRPVDVSVVIPTGNRRPAQLLRAVRSVLDQKRGGVGRVEVVVANNSRAPAPPELEELARAADVRVVAAHRVRGASHARNVGAAAARHDLLAFLDDDDWWEPSFLEEMIPVLEAESADAVLCGFWTWKAGPVRTTGKQMWEVPTLETLYLKNPGVRGSNILIRRAVFEALGGFDESLPTSNDKDFLIRFLRCGARLYPLRRRLVNLDRGDHHRLTQAHWTKVAGTRRFLELHAPFMDRETRRRLLFKLRLQEALTERSYAALLGLALERPGRAGEIFSLAWALSRGRRVRV